MKTIWAINLLANFEIIDCSASPLKTFAIGPLFYLKNFQVIDKEVNFLRPRNENHLCHYLISDCWLCVMKNDKKIYLVLNYCIWNFERVWHLKKESNQNTWTLHHSHITLYCGWLYCIACDYISFASNLWQNIQHEPKFQQKPFSVSFA